MDMVNILLEPYKLESSCFLCLKNCEDNMSSLLRKFAIFIDCKTFETRLKDIIYYLFPSHDILRLSEQACANCVDILIKSYTLLQRNYMKGLILNEIANRLNNEIKSVSINLTGDKLQLYLKVPKYDEKFLKEVTRHDEKILNKLPSNISNKSAELNNGETQHEIITLSICCKKCTMSFPDHNTLNDHKKIAHNNRSKSVICEFCGKDCKKHSTLRAHLNTHKDRTCPYCFKVLKSHSYFKWHVKSHESITKLVRGRRKKNYKCASCPFQSSDKHGLRGHINKAHLQIKPFVCDICSKGFYRKKNLLEHELIHNKNKSVACEHCGDKFLYKKTLQEHLRLHTGEKPYQCDVCKQCFITSGRRLIHYKRKHMEKSFSCSVCNKKFSLNSELNTHLRKYHCVSTISSILSQDR